MAKAKKKAASSKKSSKKTVKKGTAKRATKRAAPIELTADDRKKLLKPREGYDDLVNGITRAWESERALKVPALTPSKLRSLLKKAERAAEREADARAALERKLTKLYDERLLAEHALWRGVLDVHAAVKFFSRSQPAIGDRFAFLADVFATGKSAGPEEPTHGEGGA